MTLIGRAFMVDNDPTVAAETVREGVRVYPYVAGAHGTAVPASSPATRRWAPRRPVPETPFVDVTGMSFNTIFPNDFGFWELIDELVQQEPPEAGDPELLGLLAAVGIVHGQPFAPDDRMRKILEEAVEVGNATARTVTFAARPEEGFAYYPGSAWESALFVGGYEFLDPPPRSPPTARSRLRATARASSTRARTSSTWPPASPRRCACGSPASAPSTSTPCATATGEYLDGGRSYKLTLPPDVPRVPLLVDPAVRPPDPVDAADRPAPAPPRQPVRHGRDQRRRHDRPLVRAHRAGGQGGQLAPDRPRQGLVDDPAALQPGAAVLRQDLAAQRDRARLMTFVLAPSS